MTEFNFGMNQGSMPNEPFKVARRQLQNPMDAESQGILKNALEQVLKDVIVRSNRVQFIIPTGAVNFFVASSYMALTGAAAVTIATIQGGKEGMILTLEFVDANITITDTGTGVADTVDLSAAFTSSANDTLQLIFNGTSWREVGRSVN